jgi:hypothetical protein
VRSLSAALSPYLERQDEEGAVTRARRWFAGIWLVYDVLDVIASGTERSTHWLPEPRDMGLLATQLVLIVCGVELVRNRMPYAFGMLAVAARLLETRHLLLNDFYFYAVVMLLLAHGDGGPFERGKRPLWVRHALLVELGWIYFATGVLKLNDAWLGGGHLFVRTEYLSRGFHWPYPAPLHTAFQSLHFDAALARMAAAAELALALVLWLRRPYWLGVALVIGIHTFATLVTNVWFFSASIIALVMILLPRGGQGRRSPRWG